MKKFLFIVIVILYGSQTFSYAPGNLREIRYSYQLPGDLNQLALYQVLLLTPKKYRDLTGKNMPFKQRIALAILKARLKRQLPDNKNLEHKADLGLLSLLFGGGAFIIVFIPGIAVASIGLAVAAIVLGAIGLSRKRGDIKSIIGLLLGSVFILLLIALLIAFASGSWI